MRRFAEELALDALYALRQFVRQPKFWAVIVLTLVVGIASSTCIYAVVDGVLLKPLPYRQPDRLVRLVGTSSLRGEYFLLRKRLRTLDVAAYYPAPKQVAVNTDEGPARLAAAGVTADLFPLLGVKPALGRGFTAEETRPGGPGIVGATYWRTYGVVILSWGTWQSLFGGDPKALGKTLSIEGVAHTIVGVMPRGFNFPSAGTALWFPHNIDPKDLWAGNVAAMIGRLRRGYSVDDARRELKAAMPALRDAIPYGGFLKNYGADAGVEPLAASIVGQARPLLLILLGAIGTVLLVLCANVANLLLARGLARERELATRAALGAARRRLIRQLLVENVLVAIIAGGLGWLVAFAALQAIVALLPPDLPRLAEIRLDGRVLAFALLVSIGTGLVFGLLPALRTTREGRGLLARSARVLGGVRERRLGNLLAVLQFSLSVVLVVAAVLLILSFANVAAVDPGFRPEQLLTASVTPPGLADRSRKARYAFAEGLLERLGATPAIRSAALASALPFDAGLFGTSIAVNARSARSTGGYVPIYLGVSPGYLETMGTTVLEGRAFTAQDRMNGAKVAIVSRALARKYWGAASPVGSRIQFNSDFRQDRAADGKLPWFTVVGVAQDVRFGGLADETAPMLYLPLEQFWDLSSLRLVVRSSEDPARVAATVRTVVSSYDPSAPISGVRTYEARLGETIAGPRLAAYLLTAFAAIALFLAALGIYGTLSYAMSRRVPEIGVRIAFGAGERAVFSLLFGQGARLTLLGVALGVPIAFGAARLLSALLFGVNPGSFVVFAAVAAALSLVGCAASYLPARNATRIQPMSALRAE